MKRDSRSHPITSSKDRLKTLNDLTVSYTLDA
jgi:hypothetical protein